jgi:hypothetical protein
LGGRDPRRGGGDAVPPRLARPDAIVEHKVMPTLARIILEQTAEAPPREEDGVACDAALEEDHGTQLY